MPLYNKALLLSSYALTINMVNRILSGIYVAFAFFLLAVVLSSNAKAVDVDLVPINFTFNPEHPIDGEAIEISFEVINNGNEPANEVKIIGVSKIFLFSLINSKPLLPGIIISSIIRSNFII